MALRTITIHSRAKLNLFLKVLGTREDGFHNIISLFQAIDLADELAFSIEKGRTGITLRSTDPEIPLGNDNLIVQAYEELAKVKEPKEGEGILCEIKKRIPVGAGMGGGSSNCASTLIALNELLETGLNHKELIEIGAKLGSDVPFFFTGGTCFVKGRGELLEMITPISNGAFIIVTPSVSVNTGEAYAIMDEVREKKGIEVGNDIDFLEMRNMFNQSILDNTIESFLNNDFESVIFEKYDKIRKLKNRLERIFTATLMTGSGSSVFSYFQDFDKAWEALELYEPHEDENVCITRPVNEGYVING